jgi:hypothetical protein
MTGAKTPATRDFPACVVRRERGGGRLVRRAVFCLPHKDRPDNLPRVRPGFLPEAGRIR